jgi:hypothetical protein
MGDAVGCTVLANRIAARNLSWVDQTGKKQTIWIAVLGRRGVDAWRLVEENLNSWSMCYVWEFK